MPPYTILRPKRAYARNKKIGSDIPIYTYSRNDIQMSCRATEGRRDIFMDVLVKDSSTRCSRSE